MKNYAWQVKFELGNRKCIVHADCKEEAIILAQAKQINLGNRWDDIESAKKID